MHMMELKHEVNEIERPPLLLFLEIIFVLDDDETKARDDAYDKGK